MPRGYGTARQIAAQIRPSPSPSICKSCLHALRIRHASTAAATEPSIAESNPVSVAQPHEAQPSPLTRHNLYTLKAGVVLSRPPLLTRELHPFEKAYYFYQKRLNERLSLPFTRYFYYQKDTPADVDWKKKIRERLTPARDIGKYNAYGKDGWNDELLVGAKESEPAEQVEALLRDAVIEVNTEEGSLVSKAKDKQEKIDRPLPRETDADRNGDTTSLNRALARTLYLVVKGNGRWAFPSSVLLGKESLLRAAERIIVQAGGVNMNTWIVGHAPVGHTTDNFAQPIRDASNEIEKRGEKTFFMKARIMAGQANLKNNALALEEFKWLAREEIEGVVHPHYWKEVRGMLVER